jgi:hypothetical protein
MYEEQFPAQTSPRPFGEIPSLWVKVTQMTERFFAQEAPRASTSNTLIGVLILAAITMVTSTLSSLIMGGTQTALLPAEYRDAAAVTAGQNVLCSLCGGLIVTVVGFYLGNGLAYLGARVLGGSGDFGTQTYLQSLFAVPLGAVAGLVSLVPCIGFIVALVPLIYAIVLNVRAVKVVHNLTTGKAAVAVLWPALILVLISCLAVFVVFVLALLGPGIGNIFENIVTNI